MNNEIDVTKLTLATPVIYKLVTITLLLCAVDLVLTHFGLLYGLVEANPFASFSPLFLTYKFGTCLTIIPLTYLFSRKKSELGLFASSTVSIMILCVYVFVVSLNAILVAGVLP